MWTIDDYTNGKMKGYLCVKLNGVRVFDAFPYAKDVDAAWVIKTTHEAVAILNAASSSASDDRPAQPSNGRSGDPIITPGETR